MATARRANWFAIIVSIAVVVVLGVLAWLVVALNNKADDPGPAPKASIIEPTTATATFGKGKDVVETYVDFMCPGCGAFEAQWGAALQKAAANDEITLKIHPVAILNRASMGTNYSTRAANAFFCVADANADAALPFFNLLYGNQPEEPSAGLDDAQLKAYASQAGADDAGKCIDEGSFAKYVDAHSGELPAGPDGQSVTPTVLLNGKYLTSQERNAALQKLLG